MHHHKRRELFKKSRADLFRIFFPNFSEPPLLLDFTMACETGYAFEPKKFSKNFDRA
jgi:hypothetical protein